MEWKYGLVGKNLSIRGSLIEKWRGRKTVKPKVCRKKGGEPEIGENYQINHGCKTEKGVGNWSQPSAVSNVIRQPFMLAFSMSHFRSQVTNKETCKQNEPNNAPTTFSPETTSSYIPFRWASYEADRLLSCISIYPSLCYKGFTISLLKHDILLA